MRARFVVLHHIGIDEPHYDVMFDAGATLLLATWRSPIWPIDRPTSLTKLPDHRREYLTYEGEVSSNRGRVDRVAEGWCEIQIEEESWQVRSTEAEEFDLVFSRNPDGDWNASVVE
jgi:hypothetical protein